MKDSSSESTFHSNIFGLRQIGNSFPSIPSLFVGSSPKPSDFDSVWSPTSPLDFKLFSSLSNSLSLKSPRSPSLNGHQNQKKWDCSEVGLGIVNSIVAQETDPASESSRIIFGRQVKRAGSPNFSCRNLSYFPPKSNSLPRNYRILPETCTILPKLQLDSSDVFIGKGGASHSLDIARSSSSISHGIGKPNSSCRSFSLEKSSIVRQTSLPISIGNSDGYSGSLSSRDIELSEDYTCIISYGPNSKTTHIFGDCVLECYTNKTSDFGEEKLEAQVPQMVKSPEKENLSPCFSDESLRFCSSCNRKLGKGEEVYSFGVEKAFCCSECQSMSRNQQPKGQSLESSHHEDIFLLGIPFAS